MPASEPDVDALISRQGKGARYDAPNAPAEDLLLARRGTAFLARKIMELSDEDLYLPSRRPGQTRARLIAEISCDARRQASWLETLRQGHPHRPETLTETTNATETQDLDLAATLPARALRHLFQHTTVHLNVVWRDLEPRHWDEPHWPGASTCKVRDIPFQRARKVWVCALDLGNGARQKDVPARILRAPDCLA